MTAPDVAARVTAWLDRLEGLHTAATPGPWSAEPTRYGMDVIAAERPDRFIAAEALPADAAAIVAEHNALPALLALARGVTALAEEWEAAAARGLPRWAARTNTESKASALAIFTTMRTDAAALRRLLADAAPDTGEETA